MIDQKKSGKIAQHLSIHHDSSKFSDLHNDDASEINGISSTQRHFLIKREQQNEHQSNISFNNMSQYLQTADKGDQLQDLSSISNQEGATKRRKLFEMEEQDLGSTFRNINQRKDYYSDNNAEEASGEYEENIYRKETTYKNQPQQSKKDLPLSLSMKYSDTYISEEGQRNKIHSESQSQSRNKNASTDSKYQSRNGKGEYKDIAYNDKKKSNQEEEEEEEDDKYSDEDNSNSQESGSHKERKRKKRQNIMLSQMKFNNLDFIMGLKPSANQSGFLGDKHTSIELKQGEELKKKRPNFLNVLFYITRFRRKMKSKINLKQFLSLKYWHFMLINDESYYIKQEKEEKQTINKIFSKIKTFSPTSNVVVVWHLIILLILLIQLFFIPLKAGFQLRLKSGFWMYFLRILPAIAFSIEILLKFNTGYYQEGQVVMDQKKIISTYLKWQFWIDLSATSSILANQSIDSMWLDFVQFLHISQMTSLIQFLDDHFQISQRFQTLFELIKLGFLIVVVAHFCGCAFHFIAQIQISNGEIQTWLQVKSLQDEDWLVRYVNSLYWAIITMNTVGYGDITPNTTIEKSYVTVITLICCGVFGYAINTIGSIVREIALKEAAYKQTKYDISMYMRNRNVSRDVQLKVFKILEYQNQQELEGTHKASQILERVPDTISNQVYMEFYGKILHNCKLFRFNFSEKFISALSLKMIETTLGPGEILFKQGGQDSRIFFILKGEVDIYVTEGSDDEREKKFNLTKINAGSFFGHSEFFTNQERQFSCQASTTCNLVSLTYQDAASILKEYGNDYENFCKIRDNLLLYGNQIDQKCLSCQQFTHNILDCPLIHLTLDKEFLLKKNNFTVLQERGMCKRKFYKISSLQGNSDVRYLLRKVRIDIVEEQRPEYMMENFEDCLHETDLEFFQRTPVIKQVFGEGQEELIFSEESEDEEELEKELEEVRSNLQNQIGIMQLDNLNHMNSIKSNSQMKVNLSSIQNNFLQSNTNVLNNSSTPNSKSGQGQVIQFSQQQSQSQQYSQVQQSQFKQDTPQTSMTSSSEQLFFQKQRSMTHNSTHQPTPQGRRLTGQSQFIQGQMKQFQLPSREQTSQQIGQQLISQNSQKSLSSITDLQLQPASSNVANPPSQQPTQAPFNSIYQASPTMHSQSAINAQSFNIGNNAIISLSTSNEKTPYREMNKLTNSNLLNVDTNDIYQTTSISKKSSKNQGMEDNKSAYSSKSGKAGKDLEKQDSFIQRSPQQQVLQKAAPQPTIFGILEFDNRKDYEFYFPHNNLSKILTKMKQNAEVKLMGNLNVAMIAGNLQMRKPVKSAMVKSKLARSTSRLNNKSERNDNTLNFSSFNLVQEQVSNNHLSAISPSKFKNKL